MIQTWAMVVDAYRELNARKLFWVTLAISVLVVGVQASLGISEKGPTILWFDFPFPIVNSTIIEPAAFHKAIFYGLGYSIWLTWAATILALISTASIIPDFVSSGSIDLTLSKPIGRARLFLSKYATGVLFVALQVAVFTGLSFVVIGVRGGSWEWGLFWSVPIIVVFFSYLYAVSALVGLLTRSPITALLATGIVWIVVFGVHVAETTWLLRSVTVSRLGIDVHRTEIESRQGQLATARAEIASDGEPPATPGAVPGEQAADTPTWTGMDSLLDAKAQRRERATRLEQEIADLEAKLAALEEERRTQERYHMLGLAIKTILPKTTETADLLGRRLFTGDEFERFADRAEEEGRARGGRTRTTQVGGVRVSERAIAREMQAALRGRTEAWVVGSSLAFEGVLLAAACLIFCRKDF